MTFHELYTEYYPRAYRFVKSYVNDAAAAEDIVSESMISLWRSYDTARGGGKSILPFLYTVLRNKSLDYLRSKRVRFGEAVDSWEQQELELRISSLNCATEESIFSDEIYDIVNRTLAEMPQRTRDVFKYSRFEGKSYLEISRMFGITDKGVEYHMGLALKMLRAALKDYLPSLSLLG